VTSEVVAGVTNVAAAGVADVAGAVIPAKAGIHLAKPKTRKLTTVV